MEEILQFEWNNLGIDSFPHLQDLPASFIISNDSFVNLRDKTVRSMNKLLRNEKMWVQPFKMQSTVDLLQGSIICLKCSFVYPFLFCLCDSVNCGQAFLLMPKDDFLINFNMPT